MRLNEKNSKSINILFVCSGNGDTISPFILDQKNALESKGVTVDLFPIKGKGIKGYLKSLKALRMKVKNNSYDFIHAHYGLSGLLACLQLRVPVIVTLHGSDVNDPKVRVFSQITAFLANRVIVVSQKMRSLLKAKNAEVEVIPCGVDIQLFHPMDKHVARESLESLNKMKFNPLKKYILFSSSFSMDVKNPELAKDAVKALGDNYELIELKGYSREEVTLLLNAVDAALMTSRTEGSPQFIKEAMACNCPVVTTDVGDVQKIINGTEGCFISEPSIEEVSEKLRKAVLFGKTEGRNRMLEEYHEEIVTNSVIESYEEILEKKEKRIYERSSRKKTSSFSSFNLFSGVGISSTEFMELMEMREIILIAI